MIIIIIIIKQRLKCQWKQNCPEGIQSDIYFEKK